MTISKIFILILSIFVISNLQSQSLRKEYKLLLKEYKKNKKELVLSISNLKIATSIYNEKCLEINSTLGYINSINKFVNVRKDSIFTHLNPVSQFSVSNYKSLLNNWNALKRNCIDEINSFDSYLDYHLADTIWDINQEFSTKKQRNQSLKAFNEKLRRRTEDFNYKKNKFSESGLLSESCYDKLKRFDTIIQNKGTIISDYNRVIRWKYDWAKDQYAKEILIRKQQDQNIEEAKDLNKKLTQIHTDINKLNVLKSKLTEIIKYYERYDNKINNKIDDLIKLNASIRQFENDTLNYNFGFDESNLNQLIYRKQNQKFKEISLTNSSRMEDSLNQYLEHLKYFHNENSSFIDYFNYSKNSSLKLINGYNKNYKPLLVQLKSKKMLISNEYERINMIISNEILMGESTNDGGFFGEEIHVVEDEEEKTEAKIVPLVYDVVDEPAEFPGGMSAAREFLKTYLKCPVVAKDMGIEGKCYLKFIISTTGDISNVKVVRGVTDCPECDKEAIRLIKAMPDWIPGKINGKPVNSTFTLPVQFKLD